MQKNKQYQNTQNQQNTFLENDDFDALLNRAESALIDVFFELNQPAYSLTKSQDEPFKKS